MQNCLKCNQIIDAPIIYGLHQACFVEWFGCVDVTEFTGLDPKKKIVSSSNPEIKTQKNTFFHGKYLKYSARLGETQYILKVEEKQYPELPLIEYLCNQIAERLKIEVPPHHLIDFHGRLAFVTRNFMQDYTGTLIHIYRFLQPNEEDYNCEEIIKTILSQTGRLADVSKFIEICLFDALIGNNDRHGRNLGIIQTSSTTKIAPMYDNPSCIGTEEDFFLKSDINSSGCIWTKDSKHPQVINYITEFQRLGYDSIVKQFIKKIISKSNSIINLVESAILSQIRKDALIKLILKRLKEFENGK
jgi:hypothetical protein